jgi:hypothetical protein
MTKIVEKMAPVKGIEKSLEVIIVYIRNKACNVRMSIRDKSHETRTDCCPTYWSLIKRFI